MTSYNKMLKHENLAGLINKKQAKKETLLICLSVFCTIVLFFSFLFFPRRREKCIYMNSIRSQIKVKNKRRLIIWCQYKNNTIMHQNMSVRRKSTLSPAARPSAVSVYSATLDLNDDDYDHDTFSRYCSAIYVGLFT